MITTRLLTAAVAAVAATAALAPGSAFAGSGDDRPFPERIFSADSPFYQRMPDWTPTASDSNAIISDLVQTSHDYWGTWDRRNVDISTTQWAPTMYVAHDSDPVARIDTDNCQGKGPGWDRDLVADHFNGIHIPADARPDQSADGSMVVYNPDSGTVTETWVTHKRWDGSWTACFGGTIRDASHQSGQHRGFYGVSASGLSMAGFAIRPDELRNGHITHTIALNLPHVKARVVSWPATRTDGQYWGNAPAEGQLLRLPAGLDLNSMRLSPTAKTIARAAQEYGIIVTDTGGAVSFIAQNRDSFDHDPYPELFRGRWANEEMNGDPARGEEPFPLDKLEALPVDYHVQGGPVAGPAAPNPAPRQDSQSGVIRQSANPDGDIVDHTGATWAARTGGTFDAQNVSVRSASTTAGTSDPQLYAKGTWGMTRYGVDLPNGSYDVTLSMSEDYWNEPDRRVFDVYAEDRLALEHVDIYAAAGGRDRAYERTFRVSVTDGHLDLTWKALKDVAVLHGIQIVRR